jgi:hypothetical protein
LEHSGEQATNKGKVFFIDFAVVGMRRWFCGLAYQRLILFFDFGCWYAALQALAAYQQRPLNFFIDWNTPESRGREIAIYLPKI